MTEADRNDFAQLITDVLAYYRQDASRFVLVTIFVLGVTALLLVLVALVIGRNW